jgi:hypothetical protein
MGSSARRTQKHPAAMIRSRAYIILGILAMLLFTACGQQYQAKSLVKDFIKEHATEEFNISDFSDLDSTRVISDSLFQAMQQKAANDPMFKDVDFSDVKATSTLLYIRMRYQKDTLEMSKTFYFDKDLSAVIAFK